MLRMGIAAIIGLCLLWTGERLLDLYELERPWRLLDTDEYLEANTGYYSFYRDCTPHLGESDTTLMVNLDRPFYFPAPARSTARKLPLELLELVWSGMDGDAIADSLTSTGITHIAIDMVYTSLNLTFELSDAELEQWRYLVACRLEPVVASGRYVLLRIVP